MPGPPGGEGVDGVGVHSGSLARKGLADMRLRVLALLPLAGMEGSTLNRVIRKFERILAAKALFGNLGAGVPLGPACGGRRGCCA